MLLSTVLLFTIIIVVLTLFFSTRKLKNYNFSGLFPIIATCFFIVGFLLIWYSSIEISTALSRQFWPTNPATVIETNIVGERAYNPQLRCKYEVEGKVYTLTTDLNTPGFGSKRSRLQTAEIILNDYPVGFKLRIHYNPENPEEAYIRTGPYWSDYMKISLGMLLFAIGLYGILGISLIKFKKRFLRNKDRILFIILDSIFFISVM